MQIGDLGPGHLATRDFHLTDSPVISLLVFEWITYGLHASVCF